MRLFQPLHHRRKLCPLDPAWQRQTISPAACPRKKTCRPELLDTIFPQYSEVEDLSHVPSYTTAVRCGNRTHYDKNLTNSPTTNANFNSNTGPQ